VVEEVGHAVIIKGKDELERIEDELQTLNGEQFFKLVAGESKRTRKSASFVT
jgi:hypothetical protein